MYEKQMAQHLRSFIWCRYAQRDNSNMVIVFGNMDTGERDHTVSTNGAGIFTFQFVVKGATDYIYGASETIGGTHSSEPLIDVADRWLKAFYKPAHNPQIGILLDGLRAKMNFDYYVEYC